MPMDFDMLLEAFKTLESPVLIVCLSAVRTKDKTPILPAIEIVRAFYSQYKYRLVFVYDDPLTLPDDELHWIIDNMLKLEYTDYNVKTLAKNIICASTWKQIETHPFLKNQELELAIVATNKLANYLLNHTNTYPIIAKHSISA